MHKLLTYDLSLKSPSLSTELQLGTPGVLSLPLLNLMRLKNFIHNILVYKE